MKPISRPHSPPLTTARSLHALPHNYATKVPLVTMGRPNFTPKTAPYLSTITTPILSLNQPHSPPQTTSRSNQPFCLSTLCGPTDKPTEGQMVQANVPYNMSVHARYTDRERRANKYCTIATSYLRRQTTPQQMMIRHTARPTNPTAITAATKTVIINDLLPTSLVPHW